MGCTLRQDMRAIQMLEIDGITIREKVVGFAMVLKPRARMLAKWLKVMTVMSRLAGFLDEPKEREELGHLAGWRD